ncbi:SRPBCC family protein [Micromonospora sp. WMMD882]|uniref:SRPBCC family protein n=1 Tax=Micromonospora sp. WMMD882 TaxID=3015151 RepID=UPI00248CA64C|nr:SRPBCC family protein [Micromonospora sp. WMMD882]WBB78113.1 SRPBCC family protein [Micromonospora sp. WMMD882]
MKDIFDELAATHRELGRGDLPAGEAYTVVLRRSYPAEIEDVWDALTRPERLSRWFLPVTGDLRPGGRYQLTGNAGGEILDCEPPRRLRVSWLFGPDAKDGASEVEVRLTQDPAGDTGFELVHSAVVDETFFPTYGPGATGVGWDLALLGLAMHLAGQEIGDPAAFESSPEARELSRRSATAWGEAHLAAGGDPDQVAAAVKATTAFYVPDPS